MLAFREDENVESFKITVACVYSGLTAAALPSQLSYIFFCYTKNQLLTFVI